ncbi:hypothetical protein D9619_011979 [Psilocybe cf. subviscida]|uniref:Uncharacterized protein n=1 Tax=Psilocybe cf. subviscida TaxID=2480587 RepID=A0A8H5EW30_9AGAR|nr:hypothetical protein D9619_011979 [Psilocybe cf. subviscida]
MYPSVQSSPDFASYVPAVGLGLLDEDLAALFSSTHPDAQFTGFTPDPIEVDLFSNYFQGQTDHTITSTVWPSFGSFPSLSPAPEPSSTPSLLESMLWPYSSAFFTEPLSYTLPPHHMPASCTSMPLSMAPTPTSCCAPSYSSQSSSEQLWTDQVTSTGFRDITTLTQASALVEPDPVWTYREEEVCATGSNAYMPSAGSYESSPTPSLAYSPQSSPSASSLTPPTPPSYSEPSLGTSHQDHLSSHSYGPIAPAPSELFFIDDTGGYVNAPQSLASLNAHQLAYEPNQVNLRRKEVGIHVFKSVLPAAGQQLHQHSEVQYTAGHTAARERGHPRIERAETAEGLSTNGFKDKARAGKTGSARWRPYPVAGRGEGKGKGSGKMNTQIDLNARGRRAAEALNALVRGRSASEASKGSELDKKRSCKPANAYFKLKTGENRERADRRPVERIGELRAGTMLGIPKRVTFVGGPKRNKGPKKVSD